MESPPILMTMPAHFLEPVIGYDQNYTAFFLDLASRETTRIFIEVTDPYNLVPPTDEVVVPAGSRISAGIAAFAPHAGIIRLPNEEGLVLGEVPYNVTKQSHLQHTLSGLASASLMTDFDDATGSPVAMGVSYGIQQRSTGIGAHFSLEYSTDGVLNGRGTVSGSYSW